MERNAEMSIEALFEPFEMRGLKLANRLAMSPMASGRSPSGIPTEEMASYYAQRALGGVGLIITEGTTIDLPSSSGELAYPRFHGDALRGWRQVVEAVHRAGAKIFPQLWHMGARRRPGTGPWPDAPTLSPSGVSLEGDRCGVAMTLQEIRDAIESFARGARDAKELGFDGVELHGGHGYLIDQFLWDVTNQRRDQYGGDLVGRTEFACEVIAAVRDAVGPKFPVMFRFSQWKHEDLGARLARSPDELALLLDPLSRAGVDIFDCSTLRFWTPEFDGADWNLAGWTRHLTSKPTITVGSVGLSDHVWSSFAGRRAESTGVDGLNDLLRRLTRQEFDLVAVGRALLGDPEWAQKVRERRFGELEPFTPDMLSYLS